MFAESFEGSIDEICAPLGVARGSRSCPAPTTSRRATGSQLDPPDADAGRNGRLRRTGALLPPLKRKGATVTTALLPLLHEVQPGPRADHHYGGAIWPRTLRAAGPWAERGEAEGHAALVTQVEPGDFTSPGTSTATHMAGQPAAGADLGQHLRARGPGRTVEQAKWICLEVMVKMNDVGDSNGERPTGSTAG